MASGEIKEACELKKGDQVVLGKQILQIESLLRRLLRCFRIQIMQTDGESKHAGGSGGEISPPQLLDCTYSSNQQHVADNGSCDIRATWSQIARPAERSSAEEAKDSSSFVSSRSSVISVTNQKGFLLSRFFVFLL